MIFFKRKLKLNLINNYVALYRELCQCKLLTFYPISPAQLDKINATICDINNSITLHKELVEKTKLNDTSFLLLDRDLREAIKNANYNAIKTCDIETKLLRILDKLKSINVDFTYIKGKLTAKKSKTHA